MGSSAVVRNPRELSSWRAFVADKALLLLVLLLLAMAAAALGRFHHLLELFTHFRVFYLAGALALAAAFAGLRRWRYAAAALLAAAFNLWIVSPAYLPRSGPGGPGNLRILSANVLTSNQDRTRVLDLVRSARPDVIVLIEVNEGWIGALAGLEAEYPYALKAPRPDNFGMALYSRLPLERPEELDLLDIGVPALTGVVRVGGTPVSVLGLHTLPPGSAFRAAARNAQIAAAAEIARNTDGLTVICGDFNATPWSPRFADALSRSGLVDARRGRGIQPTWPAQYAPLMIPLDHCLVSPEIGVVSFQAGPDVGSDHLPIRIDLSIPPSGAP